MADACVYLMNLPDEKLDTLLGSGAKLNASHTSGGGHPNPPPTCGGGGEGENDFTPPLVNIGVGHDLTIRELAETVKQVTGYTGEIVFDSTKPDGTPRKLMDVSRLNSMGWQARTDFRDGLIRAYSDFQKLQTG